VGCARNDKTECGTGNKAFLVHSGFDLQSSWRYVRYLNCSRGLIIHTTLVHYRVKIKIIFFEHLMTT
jgi:hypothetical protein